MLKHVILFVVYIFELSSGNRPVSRNQDKKHLLINLILSGPKEDCGNSKNRTVQAVPGYALELLRDSS